LGSGDPSSHENDANATRQHNGLFSSFYDMFLLTRVDSHQKTIQINAKRVEGSVFSTTIHPNSIYSINVFTDNLPDESFFEKFEEQLGLEDQMKDLEKDLQEKEASLEELRQKAEKDGEGEEENEQEASAVAAKKLELEIKQRELDVLEASEKLKKVRDRLDTLHQEIFAESGEGDNEDNLMEEEITEETAEKMEEEPAEAGAVVEETNEEAAEEAEEEAAEVEETVEEEAAEEMTEDKIKAMKVAELREYIRSKGKTPKGNKKAPLVAMALEALSGVDKPEDAETMEVEVDISEKAAEDATEKEADGDGEEVQEEPVEEEAEEELEKAEEMEEENKEDGDEAENEEAEAAATETIDLTVDAPDDSGKTLCRVFIGLKEPLKKVRTSLAGCEDAAAKTYCILLEAELKQGDRFKKVTRFLEGFVNNAYEGAQVNKGTWGKRKVSKIASQLLKEAMKRRKLDFEVRECANGCGEKMKAYELQNHEQNECTNRMISCQYCGVELMHCQMAEHKTVCQLCMLRCPNNCGKTVARKDMATHLSESCAHQKIDCEYLPYGCKIKMKRKNKSRHMAERCVSHLNLMRKAHFALNAKFCKVIDFVKEKYADDFPELEEPKDDPEVVVIED